MVQRATSYGTEATGPSAAESATAPATAEPSFHVARVPASDGVMLGARSYDPPEGTPVRAVVVIHGATAVPQGYYARFAQYLSERGYRVVTYDYRGIGASRTGSIRDERATMRDWGEHDATAMFAFARSIANGLPLVAIGHSFGGQSIGLCDSWRSVDASVLVGAQFGYWGHWPAPDRWRYAIMWYGLVPVVTTAFGSLPGWLGLGTDLPKGVARQWARWCRDPDYLMRDEPRARERFTKHAAPTLFFSFSDDDYAPEHAVRALLALLPRSAHHVRMTPAEAGGPVGHFGYFRPGAESALWRPTLEWLETTLGQTEMLRTPRDDRSS
ncbi:MAG: alpha/beta fold hydrolase [Polyangiaceae bacterium]|nr:alpha/beta fold hydrolase [Polyangiaceae bacterium]